MYGSEINVNAVGFEDFVTKINRNLFRPLISSPANASLITIFIDGYYQVDTLLLFNWSLCQYNNRNQLPWHPYTMLEQYNMNHQVKRTAVSPNTMGPA